MKIQVASTIATDILESALREKQIKVIREGCELAIDCGPKMLEHIGRVAGVTYLIRNEESRVSQFKDLIPESPWGIICAVHGEQGLSDRERFNQVKMGAGCPIRGCHGRARIDGKRLDRAILKAAALFLRKGEVQPMLDLNISTVKELGEHLACIVKGLE